ncbi:cation transporter [Youxingia wuxianensis]|uniref:Heavy metal-associated domain protein n=1 Tax=Youxingia wuxianensis TaxID=2763678 RepID=A0A926ENX6_9FIRM|nr:cation transporter [Youxingia wuxianensis]MBC8585111.1 heavy metal-associated domain protein [Youxingia wuxianensis]
MPKEHAYFIVENIKGKYDLSQIKQNLHGLHGICTISADPKTHLISVNYNSARVTYDKIENRLNKLGYQIAADASNILTQ